MNQTVRRLPWTAGVGVLLLILALSLAFVIARAKSRIEEREALPVLAQVADFSLTNQDGAAVSLANLRGYVWVADIIFTRCAGPCPRMTEQMRELQEALPKDSQTELVTLTTDPTYDTPAILKRYGERFGAESGNWMFLTGSKEQVAGLAVGSLKLSAVPVNAGDRTYADDFWVHSTIFVVVDKHAQLRGVFETGGEGTDWPSQKQQLLAAAKELEREP